jgi:hypothetical protein
MSYSNRKWNIITVAEVTSLPIDFNTVMQNNINTMRKSVDGTKTFVKYETSQPTVLANAGKTEYTHSQILEILSTWEWTVRSSSDIFESGSINFTTSDSTVSTSNNTIVLTSHGLYTGQSVRYVGGTNIGGLTSGENYYVVYVDANTIKLATSVGNALSGTAISLTSVPSTNTSQFFYINEKLTSFTSNTTNVSTSNNTITLTSHDMTTGQNIRYIGATNIGGLTSGTDYYVINVDTNTIKLATTPANALSGTNITLSSAPDSDETQYFHRLLQQKSFTANSSNVSTDNNTITLTGHSLHNGDIVRYYGATAIGGLTSNNVYSVIRVDANTIKLASTTANASAGTNITLSSAPASDETQYLYI